MIIPSYWSSCFQAFFSRSNFLNIYNSTVYLKTLFIDFNYKSYATHASDTIRMDGCYCKKSNGQELLLSEYSQKKKKKKKQKKKKKKQDRNPKLTIRYLYKDNLS